MIHHFLQRLELSSGIVGAGKVHLVVGQLVPAIRRDKTLGIDQVEAPACLILGHALVHKELHNLLRNADSGASRTKKDGPLILALNSRSLNCIDHSTEDNGAGTLDVVIEASVRVAVPFQCGERILEVFELNHNSGGSGLVNFSPIQIN